MSIEIDRAIAKLTDIEKRGLPRSILFALNTAAFEVRGEWIKQMSTIFDRPTPLTLRAPLYKKATPDKLEAEVYIRSDTTSGTPPSEYLKPQAYGGARAMKPSERLLGHYYVPAPGAPLDRYGNINFNTLRAILAQAGGRGPAIPTSFRFKGRGNRRKRYFAVHEREGRLPPGIYERVAKGIRAVLFFVDRAPQYRKRFDAQALAQGIFQRRFATLFYDQLTRLVRLR